MPIEYTVEGSMANITGSTHSLAGAAHSCAPAYVYAECEAHRSVTIEACTRAVMVTSGPPSVHVIESTAQHDADLRGDAVVLSDLLLTRAGGGTARAAESAKAVAYHRSWSTFLRKVSSAAGFSCGIHSPKCSYTETSPYTVESNSYPVPPEVRSYLRPYWVRANGVTEEDIRAYRRLYRSLLDWDNTKKGFGSFGAKGLYQMLQTFSLWYPAGTERGWFLKDLCKLSPLRLAEFLGYLVKAMQLQRGRFNGPRGARMEHHAEPDYSSSLENPSYRSGLVRHCMSCMHKGIVLEKFPYLVGILPSSLYLKGISIDSPWVLNLVLAFTEGGASRNREASTVVSLHRFVKGARPRDLLPLGWDILSGVKESCLSPEEKALVEGDASFDWDCPLSGFCAAGNSTLGVKDAGDENTKKCRLELWAGNSLFSAGMAYIPGGSGRITLRSIVSNVVDYLRDAHEMHLLYGDLTATTPGGTTVRMQPILPSSSLSRRVKDALYNHRIEYLLAAERLKDTGTDEPLWAPSWVNLIPAEIEALRIKGKKQLAEAGKVYHHCVGSRAREGLLFFHRDGAVAQYDANSMKVDECRGPRNSITEACAALSSDLQSMAESIGLRSQECPAHRVATRDVEEEVITFDGSYAEGDRSLYVVSKSLVQTISSSIVAPEVLAGPAPLPGRLLLRSMKLSTVMRGYDSAEEDLLLVDRLEDLWSGLLLLQCVDSTSHHVFDNERPTVCFKHDSNQKELPTGRIIRLRR